MGRCPRRPANVSASLGRKTGGNEQQGTFPLLYCTAAQCSAVLSISRPIGNLLLAICRRRVIIIRVALPLTSLLVRRSLGHHSPLPYTTAAFVVHRRQARTDKTNLGSAGSADQRRHYSQRRSSSSSSSLDNGGGHPSQ